ncbi:MAG: DEAD/DEAH box helicase [Actinomycetota bacterium]|nr:DEAD/DEAH box helicase [Actinomycetota bacterium]
MSDETQSFGALGLPDPLLHVLARNGIRVPFGVQVATIPDALSGRDVLGRAPTGSGKTLAFGLPLLTRLTRAEPRRPTGLVLTPTRELAEQIRRELDPYATSVSRTVGAIYGGVDYARQSNRLARGLDLVVATPGRLIDLIDHGDVTLTAVEVVVIDEADRMADMGFLPDVCQLLDRTSPRRQTLLFSATLGEEIQTLIEVYQKDPVVHEIGEIEPDLRQVEHRFYHSHKMGKIDLAARLIPEFGTTLVFCRTRHGVDRVARQLAEKGVDAGWIHGGRSQLQRDAALHAFTTGRVTALVATDVAARGIHVDDVACVIHYDPPEDVIGYVHRSGRTARAGATGLVVSFVNSDQVKAALALQQTLGIPQGIADPPPGSMRPEETVPEPTPSERTVPEETVPQKPTSQPRKKMGEKQRAKAKEQWPKLI